MLGSMRMDSEEQRMMNCIPRSGIKVSENSITCSGLLPLIHEEYEGIQYHCQTLFVHHETHHPSASTRFTRPIQRQKSQLHGLPRSVESGRFGLLGVDLGGSLTPQ